MKSPKEIDQQAIEKFEKLGIGFEGEKLVDFYFYFPGEHQAYHAAAEFMNLQFKTTVSYSEYGDQWLCLANRKINMNSKRLGDLRIWMEELAGRHGGEYGGWETMIELEQHPDKNSMR